MSVERLNEIKQQLSVLTMDEKQDLVVFLTAQVDKDKEGETNERSASNGQHEEPDPYRRQELEWIKKHDHEYAGQYVALLGDKLIAHADTLKELLRLVKESGVKHSVTTRIEAQGEISFGGW